MRGLHLTADLHHCLCEPSRLIDAAGIGAFGQALAETHGLNVVGQLVHVFPDTTRGAGGVTATFLLAESHMCLHTWPELAAVTLDVYVCNIDSGVSSGHGRAARGVMDAWIGFFKPASIERHELQRGILA